MHQIELIIILKDFLKMDQVLIFAYKKRERKIGYSERLV